MNHPLRETINPAYNVMKNSMSFVTRISRKVYGVVKKRLLSCCNKTQRLLQ